MSAFAGAGIYALYYTGDFAAYSKISERNRQGEFGWPIYVGKAVPAGARKALAPDKTTQALFKRLCEHAESIRLTDTLKIEDFFCRYLVVDDIWIPLGESLLIGNFSPLWNRVLDGFGNHDPGNGRYNGKRPRWDVLHPGRAWAEKCQPREETGQLIVSEVETYLRNTPVPPSRVRLAGETPQPLLDADIVPDADNS
jgi:hypothetical protein